jgi:hypothetical protein
VSENPELKPVYSPKGGAPVIPGNPGNSGGKKGRSGRLPDEAKELCRKLWNSRAAMRSVREIIKDPKHPHFASVWKELGARGYGKPDQNQTVTGPNGGAIQHAIVSIVLPDNGRNDRPQS